MWQKLVVDLILGALERAGKYIAEGIKQIIAERKLKRKVGQRIREIKNETKKDPQRRAERMSDIINSI